MLRKAVSLLLSVLMLSGCAVKLPPKVDYTIGENTKPEIELLRDKKINQVSFETKIDEIKIKTERFVVSDSSKTELGRKANILLTAQREYYLRNKNQAQKSGILGVVIGVFVSALAVGLSKKTNDSDIRWPVGIMATSPITFLLLYGIGYNTGKGPEVDHMNSYELNGLIRDYNQTLGEQG